jgi:hypothetical protein
VSSALDDIHDGANLDNLGTPLKSNIAHAHVLDRQSAPWHLPYHCRGIVTPVHSAVPRFQALNDVASSGQQNVGRDSTSAFGGGIRGTPGEFASRDRIDVVDNTTVSTSRFASS